MVFCVQDHVVFLLSNDTVEIALELLYLEDLGRLFNAK